MYFELNIRPIGSDNDWLMGSETQRRIVIPPPPSPHPIIPPIEKVEFHALIWPSVCVGKSNWMSGALEKTSIRRMRRQKIRIKRKGGTWSADRKRIKRKWGTGTGDRRKEETEREKQEIEPETE
jgi:hypothetical protein